VVVGLTHQSLLHVVLRSSYLDHTTAHSLEVNGGVKRVKDLRIYQSWEERHFSRLLYGCFSQVQRYPQVHARCDSLFDSQAQSFGVNHMEHSSFAPGYFAFQSFPKVH